MEGRFSVLTCYQYGFAELSQWLRHEETENDQTEILQHLNGCDDCRQRLADLRLMLEEMPHGLKVIQAPDSLRDRTLHKAFAARPPVLGPDKQVRHEKKPPRRRLAITWRTILAGFSVALLATSGVLSVQLVQMRHQVANLQARLAGQSVNSFALEPTAYAEQAVGKAIVEQKGAEVNVYLLVAGTRPTTGNQVYHVWLWNHGSRISAGVFRVGPSGQAIFKGRVTGMAAGLSGIGITLEPNALTKTPQGPKVFGAQL